LPILATINIFISNRRTEVHSFLESDTLDFNLYLRIWPEIKNIIRIALTTVLCPVLWKEILIIKKRFCNNYKLKWIVSGDWRRLQMDSFNDFLSGENRLKKMSRADQSSQRKNPTQFHFSNEK
jgi:hypothetical protein